MKTTIATEEIEFCIELTDREYGLFTRRMNWDRALREFSLYLLSEMGMKALVRQWRFGEQIYIITPTDYKNIKHIHEIIKETGSILTDFLYYIALMGYQPELYQGDPSRCSRAKVEKLSDDYLECKSYGYKFIIQKEK